MIVQPVNENKNHGTCLNTCTLHSGIPAAINREDLEEGSKSGWNEPSENHEKTLPLSVRN